jgi:hypothetical protein
MKAFAHSVKKSLFVTIDPSENNYLTTHIDKQETRKICGVT